MFSSARVSLESYLKTQGFRTRRAKMENADIRNAGLKVTLPRVKILEVLEENTTRHMTAEDVYKTLLERARRSAWRPSIAC